MNYRNNSALGFKTNGPKVLSPMSAYRVPPTVFHVKRTQLFHVKHLAGIGMAATFNTVLNGVRRAGQQGCR